MTRYELALFLHLVGALAFGAGAFMSLVSLWALRRAQRVEQVRLVLSMFSFAGPFLGIGMLVNILAGFYMTNDVWGWDTDWIKVALATIVLYIAVGAVMGIRRGAIAKLLRDMPDGPLSDAAEQRIYDPLFGSSILITLALLLGIVYLMTIKPDLGDSIVAIVVAAVLGAAASLPLWRPRTRQSAAPGNR